MNLKQLPALLNSVTKVAIGFLLINSLPALNSPALAIPSFRPETLTRFGRNGYFSAPSPLGFGLWRTDGTKNGTVLIKDFAQGQDPFFQSNFITFGGKLYFLACTSQEGCEVWQSNGGSGGTKLLKDIEPGSGGAGFEPLTKLNGKLYFRACTIASGCEIWTTDGTTQGTVLLKDINPGAGDVTPNTFGRNFGLSIGNKVLFQVCLPDTPCELWATDGTEAGTNVIGKNLALGSEVLSAKLGDNLYFGACQARETQSDCGLWRTDGTEAGTSLVREFSGTGLSLTDNLVRYGGRLYFEASDSSKGVDNGVELWRTDGTPQGTVQVKDINPGVADSFPNGLTNINRKLCFGAKDPVFGDELRSSNGTEAGTVLVKDINPGGDSSPRKVATLGGKLFFGATSPQGSGLWQTDCTEPGTSLVANIEPQTPAPDRKSALAIDNFLYLVARSSDIKRGLWRTDGTAAGTVLLKGLFFDSQGLGDGFDIDNLTNVNGTLLFSVAFRVTSGGPIYELWKSDGTKEGTAKIYP